MVREGTWMTWPLVTGISWRTCLPSGEHTGQRSGITSSLWTTFSVCADEGKTRSLFFLRVCQHRERGGMGGTLPFFHHGLQVR